MCRISNALRDGCRSGHPEGQQQQRGWMYVPRCSERSTDNPFRQAPPVMPQRVAACTQHVLRVLLFLLLCVALDLSGNDFGGEAKSATCSRLAAAVLPLRRGCGTEPAGDMQQCMPKATLTDVLSRHSQG